MPDIKMVETYRGVAHPWLCDAMGHLTTRHYLGMFDDASYHFLHRIGFSAKAMARDRHGWADVKHEIEYRSEVRAGGLVVIDAAPVRIGTKSVTFRAEMRDAEDATVCATLVATTVRFHLDERHALAIEPALRETVEAWIATGDPPDA